MSLSGRLPLDYQPDNYPKDNYYSSDNHLRGNRNKLKMYLSGGISGGNVLGKTVLGDNCPGSDKAVVGFGIVVKSVIASPR